MKLNLHLILKNKIKKNKKKKQPKSTWTTLFNIQHGS